jgi:hypothetical protein
MGRKIKRTPDDLDEFLERDREDEMHDLVEFTEEDIAFIREFQEMTEEFK